MHFRHAAIAALSLGLIAGAASTAEARDGCGPGFHRTVYGWCRPNYGPRPFVYGYGPGYGHRWHRFGGYGGPRYHWHRHYAWHHRGWHGGWHRGWHHRGFHHAGWHHRW